MEIRLAKIEDVERIRELIAERIDWMNKNGIKQWNQFNYLDIFSYEYFKAIVEQEHFYVATKGNIVVGAVALLEEDGAWDDSINALYIHNLVGDVTEKGVGKFLLEYAEELAIGKGISRLRLDCQIDNKELNDYYQRIGYQKVGTCSEGNYLGCKREKILEGR